MNADQTTGTMLALRRALGRGNPELLAWSRNCWDEWLKDQRNPRKIDGRHQFTVVAALSCVEDLPLHIGFIRLLRVLDCRCSVILSVPTPHLKRILSTQARRQSWNALVQITSEAECVEILGRLSAAELLAVFPKPTLLPDDVLERAAALCDPLEEGPGGPLFADDAFIGRAREYAAWLHAEGAIRINRTRMTILHMLATNPGGMETLAQPLRPRGDLVGADSWSGIVHSSDGRIELPVAAGDDEVIVTVRPDSDDAAVIARQRANLSVPVGSARIWVPAVLLTKEPQRIRIECSTTDDRKAGADLLFHVPSSRLRPWMLSAFLNRGGAGNAVIRAFASAVGCRIAYADDEPDVLCEIPVVWGVLRGSDRILARATEQGLYFFYIDHAYFDRGHGKSYRIARNRYEAGPIRRCPSDRFDALGIRMEPWRKSGREILVCPPTDYFMRAHGCEDWLESTLSALHELTDRPIIVRKKPHPGGEAVPLQKALERAHALVTHSSNVAIEAACLGTPVFVAPSSAAAPIGRTDLSKVEDPAYPDRGPWLAHLAYNQFTFEEIGDGRAWRMLLALEDRDFV